MSSNQTQDWIDLCNAVLSYCQIPVQIQSLEDCTPSMYVAIYEAMFQTRLQGIVRNPSSFYDHSHNCQIVIDAVADDVLHLDLSHISGDHVCQGNQRAITNLIEIFHELHLVIKEQQQEDDRMKEFINNDDDEEMSESQNNNNVFSEGYAGDQENYRQGGVTDNDGYEMSSADEQPKLSIDPEELKSSRHPRHPEPNSGSSEEDEGTDPKRPPRRTKRTGKRSSQSSQSKEIHAKVGVESTSDQGYSGYGSDSEDSERPRNIDSTLNTSSAVVTPVAAKKGSTTTPDHLKTSPSPSGSAGSGSPNTSTLFPDAKSDATSPTNVSSRSNRSNRSQGQLDTSMASNTSQLKTSLKEYTEMREQIHADMLNSQEADNDSADDLDELEREAWEKLDRVNQSALEMETPTNKKTKRHSTKSASSTSSRASRSSRSSRGSRNSKASRNSRNSGKKSTSSSKRSSRKSSSISGVSKRESEQNESVEEILAGLRKTSGLPVGTSKKHGVTSNKPKTLADDSDGDVASQFVHVPEADESQDSVNHVGHGNMSTMSKESDADVYEAFQRIHQAGRKKNAVSHTSAASIASVNTDQSYASWVSQMEQEDLLKEFQLFVATRNMSQEQMNKQEQLLSRLNSVDENSPEFVQILRQTEQEQALLQQQAAADFQPTQEDFEAFEDFLASKGVKTRLGGEGGNGSRKTSKSSRGKKNGRTTTTTTTTTTSTSRSNQVHRAGINIHLRKYRQGFKETKSSKKKTNGNKSKKTKKNGTAASSSKMSGKGSKTKTKTKYFQYIKELTPTKRKQRMYREQDQGNSSGVNESSLLESFNEDLAEETEQAQPHELEQRVFALSAKKHRDHLMARRAQDRERRVMGMYANMADEISMMTRMNEQSEKTSHRQRYTRNAHHNRTVNNQIKQFQQRALLDKRSRQLARESKEELVYKHVFEHMLKLEKERIREERRLRKENWERLNEQAEMRMDSIENFYKDQFNMLKDDIKNTRKERQIAEKAQRWALDRLERDTRQQMKERLEKLYWRAQSEDDQYYHRVMNPEGLLETFLELADQIQTTF